jgi:methyltransferase (TIGR00027 family)
MTDEKASDGTAGTGSAALSDPRITADALIELRLHHPLAKKQHLLCPHDQLFWTPAGRDLFQMAIQVDPVYAPFNIARYRWFTERMQRAAREVSQILLLGAGFDSRAMALPELASGKLQVFEVDFPDKLAAKLEIFARNNVPLPAGLHHVGADLGDLLLRAKLATAGYRRDLPTVVLMEGVHFFLPSVVAGAVLDQRTLGLAPGSSLVFDLWSPARQAALNAKVEQHLGRKLFGENPLGTTMEEVALQAQEQGYGDIEVLALDRLCTAYGIPADPDPVPRSWFILEASVP